MCVSVFGDWFVGGTFCYIIISVIKKKHARRNFVLRRTYFIHIALKSLWNKKALQPGVAVRHVRRSSPVSIREGTLSRSLYIRREPHDPSL